MTDNQDKQTQKLNQLFLKVDFGLFGLQRNRYLFGNENMRILFDETVRLERSMEHTNV
jgi:hypothetical protein